MYLERLRAGGVDLNKDDMVRAAALTALEACRKDGVPREVNRLHLRGVLQGEANQMRLFDRANKEPVEPAAIIDRLVECGLLEITHHGLRLNFAYDPVAEILAAYWLLENPEFHLRADLLSTENPVSVAFREIVKSDRTKWPAAQDDLSARWMTDETSGSNPAPT